MLKLTEQFPAKNILPDRESNPGLPRDRRRSSPLDYRGLLGERATAYLIVDIFLITQHRISPVFFRSGKCKTLSKSWRKIIIFRSQSENNFQKQSFEPDLNQRPMDVWQCTTTVHRSTNWSIEGVIVVRLQIRRAVHIGCEIIATWQSQSHCVIETLKQ